MFEEGKCPVTRGTVLVTSASAAASRAKVMSRFIVSKLRTASATSVQRCTVFNNHLLSVQLLGYIPVASRLASADECGVVLVLLRDYGSADFSGLQLDNGAEVIITL